MARALPWVGLLIRLGLRYHVVQVMNSWDQSEHVCLYDAVRIQRDGAR
jgi:hypothetical protein